MPPSIVGPNDPHQPLNWPTDRTVGRRNGPTESRPASSKGSPDASIKLKTTDVNSANGLQ